MNTGKIYPTFYVRFSNILFKGIMVSIYKIDDGITGYPHHNINIHCCRKYSQHYMLALPFPTTLQFKLTNERDFRHLF